MKKVYVGNIPFTATEGDLLDHFSPRAIVRVAIPTDRETGRPRGFAFVEFSISEEAEDAIRALHGSLLGGRTIVVSEAVEKSRGSAPRGSRGEKVIVGRGRGDRRDRDRFWDE